MTVGFYGPSPESASTQGPTECFVSPSPLRA